MSANAQPLKKLHRHVGLNPPPSFSVIPSARNPRPLWKQKENPMVCGNYDLSLMDIPVFNNNNTPLDLSSTGYRKLCSNPTPDNKILCDEPLVYVSVDFLVGFWQTLYWTMFCLTWFIIPILQSWMRSGEITFKKRFLAAVRENVIFYVVAGVIGAILLLYIYFAGNYEPGL